MIKVLALIIFLSANLFAGTKDTTVSGDLNFDSIIDVVKVSFVTNDGLYSYLEGPFTVDINGTVYTDKCEEAEVFDVKIVGIGPDALNPAVMVSCFGTGDVGEYFFYEIKNKKIVSLGSIKVWGSAEVPGNGKILTNAWMGFWSLQGEYAIDKESGKLMMFKKDTYDVNIEGMVKTTFKIFKSREDNSEVVQNLKPGTKLTFLKCDISPVCKNEGGYDDEYDCDWYFLKTQGGTEGWVRFKDFKNSVEDLPWAG